ncbi:hypothetical protein RRG08_043443 [Elysia crispata]|uniref:Uncharacterized protein n=1 Tax=Elysia crispata TaxID=231223 RepID=A0AAE1D0G4_9GAST|nr:hypothetical protein RRG08_043443 [Elysia crispata]
MSHSYDAMRCSFLDEQAKEYIDKIKVFVEEAKKVVTSKDLSRETSDEAMHQAITFLSQQLPSILSKDAPFTKNEVDTESLDQLKNEMKKVQEDLFLLKTEQENQKQLANAVQKEKLKSAKQMRRHKKLASKVQDMKETNVLSLHAVQKKLTKVHSFIRRNTEKYIGQSNLNESYINLSMNDLTRAQGNSVINAPKQGQQGTESFFSKRAQRVVARNAPKQSQRDFAAVNVQNQMQAGAEVNVQNQAQSDAEVNVQNPAHTGIEAETIKQQVQGTLASTRVVIPEMPVQIRNMDLRLMKTCMLKAPGDESSWITDMVVTEDKYLIIAEETDQKYRYLKLLDNEMKLLVTRPLHKGKIKLALLTDDKVVVASGPVIYLFFWKGRDNYKVFRDSFCRIYQDDEFDITALTPLSAEAFAAGMDKKICLMHENGTIYKILKIDSGYGIFDMCATTDGAIVFCDGYDVLKIDIFTRQLVFEKVPGIEYPPSVAKCSNDCVFVCDKKNNALHLIGPSGKEELRTWSLKNIRNGDYLQHVFEHNENCACITYFGSMMVFEKIRKIRVRSKIHYGDSAIT